MKRVLSVLVAVAALSFLAVPAMADDHHHGGHGGHGHGGHGHGGHGHGGHYGGGHHGGWGGGGHHHHHSHYNGYWNSYRPYYGNYYYGGYAPYGYAPYGSGFSGYYSSPGFSLGIGF